MERCALTYLDRSAIDYELAARQHASYVSLLCEFGLKSVALPPEPSLPDAVFVEDVALVFDEVAVSTSPCLSRRGEVKSALSILERYRQVVGAPSEAALEGGDVLRCGHRVYVGQSSRTDHRGLNALEQALSSWNYEVTAVPVRGCLHLSTGASFVNHDTILINPHWIDPQPFNQFRQLVVPDEEPWAANIVSISETVLMPSGMPRTRRLLEREGFRVCVIDISEFLKAEAGMSCMGIIFDGTPR
jgi:dimethylargininase